MGFIEKLRKNRQEVIIEVDSPVRETYYPKHVTYLCAKSRIGFIYKYSGNTQQTSNQVDYRFEEMLTEEEW